VTQVQVAAYCLAELNPVHNGHHPVTHKNGDGVGLHQFERLSTVSCCQHVIISCQCIIQKDHHLKIVLDNQQRAAPVCTGTDRFITQDIIRFASVAFSGFIIGLPERQGNSKSTTLPRSGVYCHCSVMQAHNAFDNAQSDTGA